MEVFPNGKPDGIMWDSSRKIGGFKYFEFHKSHGTKRRPTTTSAAAAAPKHGAPAPAADTRTASAPPTFRAMKGRHLTAARTPHHQSHLQPPTQVAAKRPVPQPQKKKHPRILLEHSKRQGDFYIDVVVTKQPFEDLFQLHGMDVASGQRFELFLPSEKVFNILEGVMVVTNLGRPDVWQAVVDRVTLLPVEKFSVSAAPVPVPRGGGGSNNNNNRSNAATRATEATSPRPVESPPAEGQVVWTIHEADDEEADGAGADAGATAAPADGPPNTAQVAASSPVPLPKGFAAYAGHIPRRPPLPFKRTWRPPVKPGRDVKAASPVSKAAEAEKEEEGEGAGGQTQSGDTDAQADDTGPQGDEAESEVSEKKEVKNVTFADGSDAEPPAAAEGDATAPSSDKEAASPTRDKS